VIFLLCLSSFVLYLRYFEKMIEDIKPKISIIIPVYNVEKYLRQCLDSAINQTLKEIEVIIVNDCSPDNSQHLIDEYVQKDKRFKSIVHTVNKGHGGALNTGLTVAKGDYIWMIDSDDILELNACSLLYNYCEHDHLDAVTFESVNFFEDKNAKKILSDCLYQTHRDLDGKIFTGEEYIDLAFKNRVLTAPFWAYLFKREVLNNFKARENVYYEDTDGSMMILMQVKKIKSIRYTAYFRLIREDSSIGEAAISITSKVMWSRVKVIDSFFGYIKEKKLLPHHPFAEVARNHFIWMKDTYHIFILNNTNLEIDSAFQDIKGFYDIFYPSYSNKSIQPSGQTFKEKIKIYLASYPILKNALRKIYRLIQ